MRFGWREAGVKARCVKILTGYEASSGVATSVGNLLIWFCVIEGETIARQFGCAFIETSAKSRINVDNAFYNIVREIRRYNREMSSYRSGDQMGGMNIKTPANQSDKQGGCCSRCVVM